MGKSKRVKTEKEAGKRSTKEQRLASREGLKNYRELRMVEKEAGKTQRALFKSPFASLYDHTMMLLNIKGE